MTTTSRHMQRSRVNVIGRKWTDTTDDADSTQMRECLAMLSMAYESRNNSEALQTAGNARQSQRDSSVRAVGATW